MVWQNLVMDRWKLAMFAARLGPGVKLSSTNWKPGGAPVRYCLSREDSGGGFRALAEIGRREAALAEVREDRAAHDARAQRAPADRHRDPLADLAPDLAERGCAEHDLVLVAGRAALQQRR